MRRLLLFATLLGIAVACGGGSDREEGTTAGTTAGAEATQAVEATEAVTATPVNTAPTSAIGAARDAAATADQRTAEIDSTIQVLEGSQ